MCAHTQAGDADDEGRERELLEEVALGVEVVEEEGYLALHGDGRAVEEDEALDGVAAVVGRAEVFADGGDGGDDY